MNNGCKLYRRNGRDDDFKYSANPTRETVEELADELGKSIKSVIGKLSREGVYQKTEYLTKTGEKPITKKELVEHF